jgi:hypothetical protein
MSAEKQKSRAAPLMACCLIVLMLLPVLYVLSLGPAVWLVERQMLNLEIAQWFYFPLEFLSERSEFIRNSLTWYVGLFV